MSIVVCKIPRAGLGNQLFPLMKAVVKSQLTGLPLIVINYRQFSIGPYLRREKSKRRYTDYFTFEKNIFSACLNAARVRLFRGRIVNEPPLKQVNESVQGEFLYFYTAPPHWSDYFFELKDYHDTVVGSFYAMIQPRILEIVKVQKVPCIGVHIRMGDFRKLQAGEDFAKHGTVRTPEAYFVEMITAIRQIAGKMLPVTVFTDGYRHEFNELFNLPAVTMMEGNADIVDLILLSHSRVIVASATSTFSYWAGFLSAAVLIMHPGHIHESIRPPQFNNTWFEGCLEQGNPADLLVENLKQIALEYTTDAADLQMR